MIMLQERLSEEKSNPKERRKHREGKRDRQYRASEGLGKGAAAGRADSCSLSAHTPWDFGLCMCVGVGVCGVIYEYALPAVTSSRDTCEISLSLYVRAQSSRKCHCCLATTWSYVRLRRYDVCFFFPYYAHFHTSP